MEQARALARLRPRDHLRVFSAGDRLTGRLAATSPDGLRLAEDSMERSVSLATIDSVLVGRAAGRGALIGAIGGLVIGGVAGFIALLQEPLTDTPEWVVPAFGAGSGALLGGVLGLLIGSGNRRCVRVYPDMPREPGAR